MAAPSTRRVWCRVTWTIETCWSRYRCDCDMHSALALVCSNMELFDYLCCQDLPQHADNKLYLFRLYKNKNQKYHYTWICEDTRLLLIQRSQLWVWIAWRQHHASHAPNNPMRYGYRWLRRPTPNWMVGTRDCRVLICGRPFVIYRVCVLLVCVGLDPEFINIDRPENVHQSNLNEFLRLCQLNGSIVGFMCRTELKS